MMGVNKIKIIALVGVVLDLILTVVGTNRIGTNYEGNLILRYILENKLYNQLFLYFFMYFSLLYFLIDMIYFSFKKLEKDIGDNEFLKVFKYIGLVFITFIGYLGAFSWIIGMFFI